MAKTAQEEKNKELLINPLSFVGSLYANFVGVSVTDYDITLDFVYVNPQIKNQGQTVTRVTLPKPAANSLIKVLSDTVKKHDENKKRT